MVSRMRISFRFLLVLALVLTAGAIQQQEAAEYKPAAPPATPIWPYVATADVAVRSGPGAQYKTVAEIKSGTIVNASASDGTWLKIVSKHGNPPGYIQERYARPTGEPIKRISAFVEGSYIATADTYVREGPGPHYRTVAKITNGMKIHVVEAEGDWLKVQSKHGNPPGYIEKKFAQRNQAN